MKYTTITFLILSTIGQVFLAFVFASYALNDQLSPFQRLAYSLLALIFISLAILLIFLLVRSEIPILSSSDSPGKTWFELWTNFLKPKL